MVIMKTILSIYILCSLFLFSCKKSDNTQATQPRVDEKLSDTDLSLLDGLVNNTTAKLSDLKFSDSSSIQDFLKVYDTALYLQAMKVATVIPSTYLNQKKLFIAEMIANGLILTQKNRFSYPDQGPSKPQQNGIAYSFGSKQYESREKPSGSCNSNLELHGLDCSGFIYQITKKSELPLAPTADNCNVAFLNNPELWTKAFAVSPFFNKLKMEYVKVTRPKPDLQIGDIVLWTGHVGMIIQNEQLMHSSGYADIKPGRDCNLNLTIKGPQISKITGGFLNDFGDGTFKILRIAPKDCDLGGEITVHVHPNPEINRTNYITWSFTGGYPPYSFSFKNGPASSNLTLPPGPFNYGGLFCGPSGTSFGATSPSNGAFQKILFRVMDFRGSVKDTTVYFKWWF